jgi:hypothetical protein
MRLRDSFAFVVATVLSLSPVSTLGNMVGIPSEAPPISAEQERILDDNPDLLELSEIAPWALRAILAKLEGLPRGGAGSSPRAFDGLDAFEVKVLGRNPALMVVYQSSPEASLELLALIKAASGGGGKKGESP